MRKVFVAVGLAALLGLSSNVTIAAQNIGSCQMKPYNISNPITRGIQRFTGLNFMASKLAEGQIKGQIGRVAKGDFDVNLKTYSAMDLIAGKFKSLRVKGSDITVEDIHVSSIEMNTLCDFIQVNYKSKPAKNVTPLYMGFKAVVSEDDFNRTLNSMRYQQNLRQIKTKVFGMDVGLLEMMNPSVNINNNTVTFVADMHFGGTPDFMKLPVKVSTGFTTVNGRIKPVNLEINSKSMGGNVPFMSKFLETFASEAFDINNFLKDGTKVSFKSIEAKDNQLTVTGNVWVPAK